MRNFDDLLYSIAAGTFVLALSVGLVCLTAAIIKMTLAFIGVI